MIKLIKMLPLKNKLLLSLGAFLSLLTVIGSMIYPNFVSQFIKLLFVEDTSKAVEIVIFNNVKLAPVSYEIARRQIIIATIALTIIQSILTFAFLSIIVYAAELSSRFYRNEMYKKIIKLSLKNVSKLKPETIMTRVSNDIANFWEFLVNGAAILLKSLLLITCGIILAMLTDLKMSISILIMVPSLVLITFVAIKILMPNMKNAQKILDMISRDSAETIRGIRAIKTYNMQEARKVSFNETNTNWTNNAIKLMYGFSILEPIFFALINFLTIGIYSVGANQAFNKVATENTVVNLNIFLEYIWLIAFGLISLTFFIGSMFRARVSALRMVEIYDYKIDNLFVKEGLFIENNYDIKIQDLNFRYHRTAPHNSLNEINLAIPFGQTFGIIGPTSSGKSTLATVLLNNYLYHEEAFKNDKHKFTKDDSTVVDLPKRGGSITIGGNELKDINTKNLTDNIGIVYQDALLYTGTIRSNLLFAKPDATEEEMFFALKNASAYDFVTEFEEGLDHPVTQGATNLSGGQKQRISIARTLLRKPKILILDDSTSALDNVTTAKVMKNIKENYDCTTILISQKIAPIKNADQILVLNNGSSIGLGTHNELLKNCDYYHEIYTTQLEQ
ncbi:ABC transporter ATP-binding protein [Mycoplasmopsis opalescens]|uniref:ABC transporter ATP-binding protein n=1 Tax=Mycoplasmopsis opalescens TaxID=114886 RepID=UPI0004A77384|nr:ABC transporter ATP-binding protein [Mycoplasmopsis opalescens]